MQNETSNWKTLYIFFHDHLTPENDNLLLPQRKAGEM